MRGNITWCFSLWIVGFTLLLWFGCTPRTDYQGLHVDKTDLTASSSGDTLKVAISSRSAWTATADQDWLKPNATKGAANGKVIMTINVDPNFGETERQGTVEIASENEKVSIQVSQKFGDVDISRQQYDLKVIFHVLYNAADEQRLISQNSPTDNLDDFYPINSSQLQEIIDYVNDIYKGWPKEPPIQGRDSRYYADGERPFQDLNLKFSLATEDPEGKQLTPAGIIRHEITEHELDISTVMNDSEGGVYHTMAFPISDYVNVFIFPFKASSDETMTLGVANLPHGTTSHPIPGLGTLDTRPRKISNYNHCVVINSKIFEPLQQTRLPQAQETPQKTLAHELGHIVGLKHVFGEETNPEEGLVTANSCADSDHCEDTFSYNRLQYDEEFGNIVAVNSGVIDLGNNTQMNTLRSRFDCERSRTYLSTNVMDYDWGYADRFTQNQYNRAREVLYFSFSIPGFKAEEPTTRATRGNAVAPQNITRCVARLLK